MQRILTLLLLLLAAPSSWAAWAITNTSVVTVPSGSSVSLTMVGADTIIVSFGCATLGCGTLSSITTTGGSCLTAFSKAVGVSFAGGYDAEIWAATGCSTAITAIVPTWTVGGSMSVRWFTLTGMTVVVDATGNSSGALDSFPNPQGASVTTTKTGDFILSNYNPQHFVFDCNPSTPTWTNQGDTTIGHCNVTSTSAAPGTYFALFNTSSAGAFASVSAAFVAATLPMHSTIIKFGLGVTPYRIPWDRPRRRLLLETI